jgi:hypothetical protein
MGKLEIGLYRFFFVSADRGKAIDIHVKRDRKWRFQA